MGVTRVERIAAGVLMTVQNEQSQYLVDVIAVVVADGCGMSTANELHQVRQLSLAYLKLMGGVQSSGFLLSMHDLFERFVFRRLSGLLSAHGLVVRGQLTMPFDADGQATIRPDLVIHTNNRIRLVADTKYKDVSAPEPADLYQMLAYCRVMKIDYGLLITAGKQTPMTYRVSDGETVIDVRSVDLDGPIADVNKSVEALATWIRKHVTSDSKQTK